MTDVTWNPAGDDDTSFGPLTAHNVLGGRTAADAHPAAAVSYDNDVSGLTGDTVQEAIDELATSGGAVSSVNGEVGVVVLDAGDVGAVPTARTITGGTGLTGGGDLSADRTLTVTYGATAGTAAEGNDARLSDARTPLAHAASHQDGGSDELALDGSQITSGTVAAARLGSGTPSAGTVLHGDGVWQLAPAQVAAKIVNGEYCAPVLWAPTTNHGLTAVGRMALTPVVLPAGTATRLTVSITANAASTWRLGLYPAGASWLPDGLSPVVGGGTISTASGSVVYASISVVLPAGLYWAAALCEAYTATPTVYGSGGAATGAFPVILPQAAALNGAPNWSLFTTGVTPGALPNPCPPMTPSYNAPRVTVRMT